MLAKRSGTYKKVPLHMRRRCEGGCSKRANLTGKTIFRAQKTNCPVWRKFAEFQWASPSLTVEMRMTVAGTDFPIPAGVPSPPSFAEEFAASGGIRHILVHTDQFKDIEN